MGRRRQKKSLKQIIIGLIIIAIVSALEYYDFDIKGYIDNLYTLTPQTTESTTSFDLSNIPEYTNKPNVTLNNNIPGFTEEDYTTEAFEKYSKLDKLGRCGVAYANICKETMPKANEERGEIGSVKPSGWKTIRYNGIVEGNYLYNRCHLIGWQLSGENANKNNLITGTRYMNTEGMLPFENQVDDYLEENPKNHVLYRVTPIYIDNNLVASGVQMEAYSIEDNGEGICFNVYVYNVQPGIVIDYTTGKSKLEN